MDSLEAYQRFNERLEQHLEAAYEREEDLHQEIFDLRAQIAILKATQ